jgi:hypothetical protein
MSFAFPHPKHMPCPDCGASVPVHDRAVAHVCDEDRRLDFQLVEHGDEIEGLERALGDWLATPQGRFAAWLAEHGR